ncbi:ribonuclease H [uncultured Paracoccus sp.]|uniref:ribonuclease H family protein n=1 Tax=uncultured Paracoccus sp. TaxID=189685 RepID=UPI00262FDF46|nr:ribonuclease H [uncultured Paracoccus sp.]
MNHIANSRSDQPSHDSQTCIEIYTDGSSIGNPGPGGYGGVLIRRDATGTTLKIREIWGASSSVTTNIRMEMTAALMGLRALGSKTAEPVTVFCDCDLIPRGMNQWLAGWKAKGWRKGNGRKVENCDLWVALETEASGRNVTWKWVRGHDGTALNERADRLAYRGARLAERKNVGRM